MATKTYGPAFRWFAWRPVDTRDRGVRWLRVVWRRRVHVELDRNEMLDASSGLREHTSHFETSVEQFPWLAGAAS